MTYQLPVGASATDDTPVDERPPYGEPFRWGRFLLVVGLVLAVLIAALVVLCRVVGMVFARLLAGQAAPAGMAEGQPLILYPDAESYAGQMYTVEFYDGTYRQLTDVPILAPIDLTSPDAGRQVARLAFRLQQMVNARDAQRCFCPRVVLRDGAGHWAYEWSAAA